MKSHRLYLLKAAALRENNSVKTNLRDDSSLTVVDRSLTPRDLPYNQTGYRAPAAVPTVALNRGAVFRIDKSDGIDQIRVVNGIAWLTGPPGNQDVLLQAGDQLSLTGPGPFVIETLRNVEMVLRF